MGTIKLTDRTVSALRCPEGRRDALFFDADLKGFGIRVTEKGARLFLYQYRVGQAVRRQTLGDWPNTTAAQARRLAEAARGGVKGGSDPVAERIEARAKKLQAEQIVREKRRADAFTFGVLIEEWESKHLAGMRASYQREAPRRLRVTLPELLDRPAASITKTDAVAALDRVAGSGESQARRVLAYGRAAYSWAIKRQLVQDNPFQGIPPIGRHVARDRVLNPEEIAALWRGLAAMEWPFRDLLQILLLTAQRREEVCGMRWSELAANRETWTLPKERAKNKRAHIVHLTKPVRDIIAALPRFADAKGAESDFIFTTTGKTVVSGFSRAKDRLDGLIAEQRFCLPKGAERTPDALRPYRLQPWTLHDFRRTAVTWMAGNGVAPHVADRILNHTSGTISGVAAVYQRGEFLAERKAALEAWAAFVVSSG